ncbi:hypothetical protein [Streptomyces sp. NPDC093109]|uniref:hypothetical protein n=1 Tax=Streptomyces sp. NPDC093109 TaxID=3154977 RepID=UPI00344D3E01
MPVGELVAEAGEVAVDDVERLVREVAEPLGDVLVGWATKSVVEVGAGGEDFVQSGEDAVVGGGQLGQCIGGLLRVVASRRRSARWVTEEPSGR